MTTSNYQEIPIKQLSRTKKSSRTLFLNHNGMIRVGRQLLEAMEVSFKTKKEWYLHIIVDNDGILYIHMDHNVNNGIRMRPTQKLEENAEGICQCKSLVEEISERYSLQIGSDANKSVRLPVADNPIKENHITLWQLMMP
jgi:hypothetical protein